MKFTAEEIEFFETQSLENVVWFYRSELRRILRGEKAKGILSDRVRRKFVDCGIIAMAYDFGNRGSVYYVTPLGKEMIRVIGGE